MAARAHTEKLQFVRDRFKAVTPGDPIFERSEQAFFDFTHIRAPGADEMMVMAVVTFRDQLKARYAISKIESLHDIHFLEQMHRAIDRRQITSLIRKGCQDFFVRKRMSVFAQNTQNGSAWTS